MSNQKPHITSYEKGMNKDINVESMPENIYVDALNFRLFTTGDGAVVGGIHNIKGTKLVHRFYDDERVIGTTQLRDALVVFTAVSAGDPSTGKIYKLEFDFVNDAIDLTLIYESDDLEFTAAAPIEAIAVRETKYIQRVYWSDFTRPTRSINIADPNVQNLPVSSLDIFPEPPFRKPQIKHITEGGNLPTGLYNLSYYLVTPGGQKTLLAPVSNQVHIVTDAESVGSTSEYQGDYSPGEIIYSTKSITISIDTSGLELNQFNKIVFVAIHIEEFAGTPSIYAFEERQLGNVDSIETTLNGTEAQELITLEDFLNERYAFYTNKTFAAKDNILFVSNVKGNTFVIPEEDTPNLITKRYNSSSQTYTDPFVNPFNDESGTVFGSDANGNYNTWLEDYQYMFRTDGTTLGGEAPWLRYKFTLEDLKGTEVQYSANVDNPQAETEFSLSSEYTEVNRTFDNFASPYNRVLRGYKRGETYRFGIIFFDKTTGLPSPVYFVGDIKFPEMSQPFGSEYPSGKQIINPGTGQPAGIFDHYAVSKKVPETGYTQLYTLGLEFFFSFPDSILDSVKGWQIVRVPRTTLDKTRLGQGVINKYYNIDVPELFGNGEGTWGGGDHWPERAESSITLCPVAELTDVFGHLNRYRSHNFDEDNLDNSAFGEEARYGLKHLSTDGSENYHPEHYGYINGSTNSFYTYYQTMFSTGGILNFFSPEINYDYGLPSFRQGIDYLKAVGLFSDTYKRNASPNHVGPSGETRPLGHIFSVRPLDNEEYSGYNTYRPVLTFESSSGAGFFKFPNTLGLNLGSTGDNREFTTIAMSTDRLGKAGNQSAVQDISNPTGAAFNLPSAYEKMTSYQIGTTKSPFRNCPLYNVNGAALFKMCFQTGNPFGYFTKYSRLAKEGKSAIISLMNDIKDPDEWFTKGRFVGKTFAFDSTNSPNDENAEIAQGHQGQGNAFIVEHVRRLGEQYGGNTPDAIASNYFIVCSDPIDKNTYDSLVPVRVFQGDTFVCMYEFMKNFYNNYYSDNKDWNNVDAEQKLDQAVYGSNSSTFERVIIPIETTVNIDLGAGTRLSESATFNELTYRTQEYLDYKGNGNDTSGGRSKYFHLYDGVFSEDTASKKHVTLPPGQITPEDEFDVRTHYSAVKQLGENRDSWTDFLIADYLDIDTQYGPINRIVNFKDNIYAFQDNGIGTFLINTRELLNGSQGAALSIGTGQGLEDYKYLSTEYGSINQFGIVKTDNGIYCIDANRQKFLMVTDQVADLSEVLGMNDFLRKNLVGDALLTRKQGGDNPLLSKGSHMTYDPMNKEVWLSVLGNSPRPDTHFTLCFSEVLKAYSAFYTPVPRIYLQGTKKIISSRPFLDNVLYMHDSGDYGQFYDLDPVESSITIRVNSLAIVNKILRFIEYNSIVKDMTVSPETVIQDQALSSILIENDYQSSGKISLEGRQKRRFRKWRIKLPRDVNSTNALGRFRGTYFDVTLFFDNSVNLSIMLERIMSYYDAQQF